MTTEKREASSPSALPRLDTVETTARVHPPESYSAYRQNLVAEDFESAVDLYCHFDNIEGTTRTKRLLECRRYAWFVVHKTSRKVKVASNACRLRWCPICSKARYQLIREETRSYLLSVRKPKFLTLTLRHTSAPLSDQIEDLYRHFRLFRQHKGLKSRIRGGCWFFQVKRAKKTGEWHPHLHCVLDADYIPKTDLQDDWRQTTGDSYIVDIRAVKDAEKVSDYVSRYAASPCRMSNFTPCDRYEVFTVLHGRRLCGVWGTGRKISFRPRPAPDRADWLRVGSWREVITLSAHNATFKALWRAFTLASPLTEGEFNALQTHDYLPDCNDWRGYETYHADQLEFEDYVKR
jgi:hypothetical protein